MGGYIGARSGTISATVANVQDVTATDSTPEVTIVNNTHEDSDGGREGKVIFKGQQSGGEESTLAEIQASHDGTADDEKGDLIFRTNDGSDGSSPTEAMRITSQQRLGLGTTAPSEQLHISNADDAVVLVESTGSDATDDANIQLKTTNGTFTIQNDRSIGTSGALTIAGNTSNNIVVDHDSGNVGISKVPNSWRTTDVALQLGDSTSEYANFVSGGTGITFGAGWYRDGASNNFKYTHSSTTAGRYDYNYTANNAFTWHQAASGTAGNDITFTEAMRLDSSGRLHIGSTVHSGSTVRFSVKAAGGGSEYGVGIDLAGLSAGTRWLEFRNVTSTFGNIDWSGSVVRYNTNSDYRLKTNITDLSNGITKVKQLQPREFSWIHSPNKTVDGFIAHEAATVVPEAVSGTHNEVEVWREGEELPDGISVGDNKLDNDGNTIPKYQGIDQAKLVPVLTAALQEAIAKIEDLETRVAALEAE